MEMADTAGPSDVQAGMCTHSAYYLDLPDILSCIRHLSRQRNSGLLLLQRPKSSCSIKTLNPR